MNVAYAAVGMPWRAMNALAKSFELSSCAAALRRPEDRAGPRRGTRRRCRRRAAPPGRRPSARRSRACANATSVAMSTMRTLIRPGSRAVPALPGATNTLATRGDCATFHASACSRPPPPTTRTFIGVRTRCRAWRLESEGVHLQVARSREVSSRRGRAGVSRQSGANVGACSNARIGSSAGNGGCR